jgi:hypothetical protein
MKRLIGTRRPSGLRPNCSGKPSAEARLQELIDGMRHIDTSQEAPWIRRFQADAIMPNPEAEENEAKNVLLWCARNGFGDQFLMAAMAYRGDVELQFARQDVIPQNLRFLIAALSRCPDIKGLPIPIPPTGEHANSLATALALNRGLNWLELHALETAPPDSTAMFRLFSHPTARAGTLSELRIHVKDEPAGDTEWMPALCDALTTRLKTESARLTLPWTRYRLKLLFDAIAGACPLKSLSFPDCSFDEYMVDAVVTALGDNRSLTQLDLGDTPLTPGQRDKIATALWNNKNIAAWESLGGVAWV